MADASHNVPFEPEVCGYFFQIPEKAEVKRVPMSMLSTSVQQKITRLGGSIETSHVIVVSPITMQRFPSNCKAKKTLAKTAAKHPQVTSSYTSQRSDRRSSLRRADARTREEQGTYLVPVKCFSDIAHAILQLSQINNPEKLSVKSELQALGDSLNISQQAMIKMEATALYMCKNVMYLLPKGKKAEIKDEKCEAQEKVVKSEVINSQQQVTNFRFEDLEQRNVPKNSQLKMKELNRNSEGRNDDLGCVSLRNSTFLEQQNGRSESRATVVKSWDEDSSPSNDRPSSRPSTEDEQQISLEQSGGPRKRKCHSISNEETSIKKICQSGPGSKSVPASSPLRTRSSSSKASSLRDLQELPPLFSDANSPDLKDLSPSPHSSSSKASSPRDLQELQPLFSDANNPDLKDLSPSPHSSSSKASSPRDLQELQPLFSDANNPDLKDLSPGPHSSSSQASSPRDLQELQPLFSDANNPDLKDLSPSPHSSSSKASSPRDLEELPPLFSDANNPDLKDLSPSPHSFPALPGAHPTYGDYTAPPHLESKSSESESSKRSEPGDTASLHDTLPISNYLESPCSSLLDIDDTTRDERTQKLLARVREWNKRVDDMRQKEDVSEIIAEIQDVPKGEPH
ncbi:serine-rich adhesin for platelets-like [Ranitomeya imitator]|uniref:serine-rich adhesin for platelets-like n=1 Tax=Ranitomeya imitator TaxID=111125 RepID=UPI0037E6F90D